ncbi:MAG: antibiotic biosynthesis monooxygenase [Nocardioidaceae bacterium]|nr:antibiotic biosynthesis monooxygenase [Nocardioidaceae bacterium]
MRGALHPTLPDVAAGPARSIALVMTRYVEDTQGQLNGTRSMMAPYGRTRHPDGFRSLSVYASTDGEHLLSYAQWSDVWSFREFQSTTPGDRNEEFAEPVPYELYRSRTFDDVGPPRLLVAPTFDVDGPNRQRTVADTLLDGALGRPIPGLAGSHFHLSLDGTRVLNWARWTSEQAHEAFMRSDVPEECFRSITMPGVRGIGGKRYILVDQITATELPS